MTRRRLASASSLSITLLVGALAATPISGQERRDAAPGGAKRAVALPTVDGHPDFQGTWSFATLTPLERPKDQAGKDFLTDAEVAKLQTQAKQNQFVDRPPPPGNPGAYNAFWIDFGTTVVKTRRTSLVVDPPDGKVPALTPEGQAREDTFAKTRQIAANPEDLPIWDRCIVGFNAGPPVIPSGYNNNLQILQTRDYLVIRTEMVHDARIIPMDGRPHLPSHLRQWNGDSRAHWEGESLVIETTNFTSKGTGTLQLDPEFARRGLGGRATEKLRLVERLKRLDAATIVYEFTVNDPETWTRPWTASVPMARTNDQVYEYACHEGNYGMHGILAGARAAERSPSKTGSK